MKRRQISTLRWGLILTFVLAGCQSMARLEETPVIVRPMVFEPVLGVSIARPPLLESKEEAPWPLPLPRPETSGGEDPTVWVPNPSVAFAVTQLFPMPAFELKEPPSEVVSDAGKTVARPASAPQSQSAPGRASAAVEAVKPKKEQKSEPFPWAVENRREIAARKGVDLYA